MDYPLGVDGRRVGLAVLCVLAVVVAVQLADPFDPSPGEAVTEPGPDANASEILEYSFRLFGGTDYALDVDLIDESGNVTHYYDARVSYSEREYYYEIGSNTVKTRYYGNADSGWAKQPGGDWRPLSLFESGHRFRADTAFRPFDARFPGAVETSVVNRTDDALWIRAPATGQNNVTRLQDPFEHYTLYRLDPDSYRLQKAVEVLGDERRRNVYRVGDWGEATVERPPETEAPLRDVAGDLLS